MAKTESLPGMAGPGVAPLSIPAINKKINRYEKAKEARCNASPAEIAAKQELKAVLQEHRDTLPVNEQGQRYYRYDDVDYMLDESVKRRRADTDGGTSGGDGDAE